MEKTLEPDKESRAFEDQDQTGGWGGDCPNCVCQGMACDCGGCVMIDGQNGCSNCD